jgi:hypothetical protein
VRLSGKNPSQKKAGRVAHGVGPKFQPQYHQKKKKKKKKKILCGTDFVKKKKNLFKIFLFIYL